MSTEVLRCQDLIFGWRETPVLVLESLCVAAGERVFLSGPSGSGKSSLLALIAGLVLPRQGSVAVAGQDLAGLSAAGRDRWRARHLGIIFQQFNLVPYLSGLDNVLLAASLSGIGRAPGKEQALALAQRLELSETLLARKATELSVGQQQRVAAVRAMIAEPALLIADEPTSALDDRRRDHFMTLLLRESERQNSAVLFVSHDQRLAAHFDRHLDLPTLNGATPCSGD
ncbi:ABC transporter [Alcanivorax xiamenensis]|uniref:ABC transporter n=1 Tax=Alcanivorax xiamenensis TaxID=1177156 RepID=A0ABQ6YA07_9GAMM|nr:ATP-binding cassette domain-containing protein [Alcanivorax xiamenensis]KAF0806662.1 ABC transporter [Alcanivorax xiamenensis]